MNYNLTRHIELLKPYQDYKNIGKELSEEEPENFLEFWGYQLAIENHLYWNNRFIIFSIVEKFLNGSIDRKELSYSIFALQRAVTGEVALRSSKLVSEYSSGKFQDLNLNFRFKGPENFGSFLLILCDYYDDYEDDSKNQKFSEEVKDWFLKFKEDVDSDEEKDKFEII